MPESLLLLLPAAQSHGGQLIAEASQGQGAGRSCEQARSAQAGNARVCLQLAEANTTTPARCRQQTETHGELSCDRLLPQLSAHEKVIQEAT